MGQAQPRLCRLLVQGHQNGLFGEWSLGTVSGLTGLKSLAAKCRLRCLGGVTGYWLWMLGLLLGKCSEGWVMVMRLPGYQ